MSSLEGRDEHKLEYIKTLIALMQDDARHVMLYVTADFGVVLLFLTQIPLNQLQALPLWARLLLAIGLASAALSALGFFRYVRRLNANRFALARCIPSLDVRRAQEIIGGKAGVWAKYKARYFVGVWLLGTATVSLAVVLVYMLLFDPTA